MAAGTWESGPGFDPAAVPPPDFAGVAPLLQAGAEAFRCVSVPFATGDALALLGSAGADAGDPMGALCAERTGSEVVARVPSALAGEAAPVAFGAGDATGGLDGATGAADAGTTRPDGDGCISGAVDAFTADVFTVAGCICGAVDAFTADVFTVAGCVRAGAGVAPAEEVAGGVAPVAVRTVPTAEAMVETVVLLLAARLVA